MKEQELFERALTKYGMESQLGQLQEECAELIVEVSHFKRNRARVGIENLAEEMADVRIMLNQIEQALHIKKLIAEFEERKLRRLEDRIQRPYIQPDKLYPPYRKL
jgi:NTP pyrophosphatase (non-canonical NTP hydrolase)